MAHIARKWKTSNMGWQIVHIKLNVVVSENKTMLKLWNYFNGCKIYILLWRYLILDVK